LSENSYCISSDSSSGTCSVVYGNKNYDENVVVFDVSISTNAKLMDISNDEVTNKMVLYDCAYNACIQTYGYIQKNGEIYECSTKKSTKINSIIECNEETVGQVMYTDVDGFQICTINEMKVSLNGKILFSYTLKKVGNNYHYVIKPYPTYDNDFFGGDYEYSNTTSVKTQENIAVLTMRSKYINFQ